MLVGKHAPVVSFGVKSSPIVPVLQQQLFVVKCQWWCKVWLNFVGHKMQTCLKSWLLQSHKFPSVQVDLLSYDTIGNEEGIAHDDWRRTWWNIVLSEWSNCDKLLSSLIQINRGMMNACPISCLTWWMSLITPIATHQFTRTSKV